MLGFPGIHYYTWPNVSKSKTTIAAVFFINRVLKTAWKKKMKSLLAWKKRPIKSVQPWGSWNKGTIDAPLSPLPFLSSPLTTCHRSVRPHPGPASYLSSARFCPLLVAAWNQVALLGWWFVWSCSLGDTLKAQYLWHKTKHKDLENRNGQALVGLSHSSPLAISYLKTAWVDSVVAFWARTLSLTQDRILCQWSSFILAFSFYCKNVMYPLPCHVESTCLPIAFFEST